MPNILIYQHRNLNRRYQFWTFWLEQFPQRMSNGEIRVAQVQRGGYRNNFCER